MEPYIIERRRSRHRSAWLGSVTEVNELALTFFTPSFLCHLLDVTRQVFFCFLGFLFSTFLLYAIASILLSSLAYPAFVSPVSPSRCLSHSVPPFHHADSGRSGGEGERGRHRDQRSSELPHRPCCRCQEPQGALIKNSPQLLLPLPPRLSFLLQLTAACHAISIEAI